MLHYRSLSGLTLDNVWMTIGSFDGVHLGHQEIVRRVVSGATQAGVPSVLFTFYPYPAVVLGKRQDPLLLTPPDVKADLLGKMGVDYVVTYPFTVETSMHTAEEFIDLLHGHLGMQRLLVGEDFALGRGREGDVIRLEELGRKFGYKLEVVTPVRNGDVIVSSSQIRKRLFEGDVAQAERLLGRRYMISGEVVHGDARGKLIGIPTANLDVPIEQAIPKTGVYVCQAYVGGNSFGAVANIGYRPTFDNGTAAPKVEAHLLDFGGDLYGSVLSLEYIERLRDEMRFSSVQSLIEQIQADISSARNILDTPE